MTGNGVCMHPFYVRSGPLSMIAAGRRQLVWQTLRFYAVCFALIKNGGRHKQFGECCSTASQKTNFSPNWV
jgi:hypothetical protein